MTTTSGSDGRADSDLTPEELGAMESEDFEEMYDEMCACSDEVLWKDHQIPRGLPPRERRKAIREWIAYADGFVTPERLRRIEEQKERLRAAQDDEWFATTLSQRGLQTMPQAIRKLYRQNPNNPKISALYDTMVKELYERTDDKLKAALLPAVDKMVDLLECGDEKTELRAATWLIERLRGKTPEVIEHRQERPFEVLLHKLITGPRAAAVWAGEGLEPSDPSEDVLEAEVVATAMLGPSTNVSAGQDSPYAEEEALMRAWRRGVR
jgi:hypothetical protein